MNNLKTQRILKLLLPSLAAVMMYIGAPTSATANEGNKLQLAEELSHPVDADADAAGPATSVHHAGAD